jgi:ectoine hydroxylase-related dioxygenase (phytanoyl-CoA dioxygenase family)
MNSYGINIFNKVNTKEEAHLEEFYNLGYTIIPNLLNKDELFNLRTELDAVYKQQEKEFTKENLKKINEENLARIPLAYSELYVKLASRKDMLSYVEKILGNFYVLHLQNGIINMPNEAHHQSSWHRDLPYQSWTSSEPLACNLYYCLDEFNSETGATFLLPFSHQFNHTPSVPYMEKHAIQISAPAGSVILFNSMLLHKAGYNKSANIIRRGINHTYVKPIISQQINLPQFLNGKYADDELLSMLFGYKSQPLASVNEYRTTRLNKK